MAKPLELEIVIKVNDMAGPELSSLASTINSLEPSLGASSQLLLSPLWLEFVKAVGAGLVANSITGAINSRSPNDNPEPSNALGRYFQALEQTYQVPEFIGRKTDSLLDNLFEPLADSFERGLDLNAAMELAGASYRDVTQPRVGARGGYTLSREIYLPEESSIDEVRVWELAAQKTHELAFAQQEAAEMARAFGYEQRKAAEAVVYWNEINPAFISAMGAQMDQVELLTLGFGEYQQVWDDTFKKITFDGKVTAEEFERLTGLQKELGFAMEATRFAAGQLSETNLMGWAESVGISSQTASAYIALITGAGDDLQFVLDGIAEGKSPERIAAQLEEMNAVGGPPLSDLAGKAGMLESHLGGIPADVNSNVSVRFDMSFSKRWSKDLEALLSAGGSVSGFATGGPLSDLALVGEEGPELIVNGIVIPAQETRKLMALGLLPKRRFALGGPLDGGAVAFNPPIAPDFDPLNLDQRAQLRASRTASAGSPSRLRRSRVTADRTHSGRERQTAQDLSLAIEAAISSSVAAVLPDAAVAATQAAAAVAPSTFQSASEQLSRQLGRDIQVSNERLMARIDQLILETRRMKIYFRDAVRFLSN